MHATNCQARTKRRQSGGGEELRIQNKSICWGTRRIVCAWKKKKFWQPRWRTPTRDSGTSFGSLCARDSSLWKGAPINLRGKKDPKKWGDTLKSPNIEHKRWLIEPTPRTPVGSRKKGKISRFNGALTSLLWALNQHKAISHPGRADVRVLRRWRLIPPDCGHVSLLFVMKEAPARSF